ALRAHRWKAVGAVLVLVAVAAPFVGPLLLSPVRDSIVLRRLSESNVYAADLLAFFVPNPRHPLLGALVAPFYRTLSGNPYEQTVYLGYALLILAALGLWKAGGRRVRFFAVVAATYFVLALGPFLHVYGRYRWPVDGEAVSVPLPYLLLHYVPFLNGVRVPSR